MKKIIMVIFALVFSILSMGVLTNQVAAADSVSIWDYTSRIEYYTEEFVGDENRQARVSGSKEEQNAAEYISNTLKNIGLVPVTDSSTENGIQKFNIYNGNQILNSQNVIYKRVGADSSKKVILATHYDIDFDYEYNDVSGEITTICSEGVFSSGANVGGLLALAELVSSYNFDFDVEFVFFGSFYNNLAGSEYYTSFLTQENVNNILLMVNLDKLVSTGKLYMYTGEFENSKDEFVTSQFSANLNARNLSDYNIISSKVMPSVSGLPYSNFALESDNAHFIRIGVKTLSLYSIADECVDSMGVVSYCPPVSVKNDKLSVFDSNNIDYATNISLAINGIVDLITHENFLTELSAGKTSNLYGFIGNQKLIVFITIILFIVICFIVYIIHEMIDKKSRLARESMDYASIMGSIKEEELEDIDKLVSRLEKEIQEKELSNAQRVLTKEEIEIIKKAEAQDEEDKSEKEKENNEFEIDNKNNNDEADSK